ncbi:ribonuclease III [Candidatus Saccharibacteria bacterium]|nr:ribonuclease III [Candidatus Saccharibacteria bacterium]
MDTSKYQQFAKEKLGFEFHDINLLVVALTHRSYVNEHRTSSDHNERLEYLGDAVLELVTSDYLYRNFNEPEGVMTAWRSALVRTESIGDAGIKLGYAPLVRLSHGEKMGLERAHAVIMADCFEAVIGAIYLDQGYDTAKAFIEKHILVKIDEIIESDSWRDAKSYFQELVQKGASQTPTYRTIKDEGPDHDKTFTVAVYVGKKIYGVGVGHSKQDAQTAAAREGIKKIKSEHPSLSKKTKK